MKQISFDVNQSITSSADLLWFQFPITHFILMYITQVIILTQLQSKLLLLSLSKLKSEKNVKDKEGEIEEYSIFSLWYQG